jgi:long-chain acyl-CoA synthetase
MLATLQHLVSDPKKEILLFDESQQILFTEYALSLLNSGFSIGAIVLEIIESLNLEVKRTDMEGVFICPYSVPKPSILCFSSGTKNNQKGIVRTYQSWQHSFDIITTEISDFPTARAIVLGALPYSLSLFGVMESLARGKAPMLLSANSIKRIEKINPTENYILWTTPSHCSFFIQSLAKAQMKPIETVKYVFVGGAYFSNQLRGQLQKVFPAAKIYSFYGSSETSFIALKKPEDTSSSVGKICHGVEVFVADENNQKLPVNSVGTIWIKSNQLFSEYFQKSFKISKLDDYISTNDKGFMDSNNRLFFSGRTDRKVSISGHIIDLNTLEKWYKNELQKEDIVLLIKPNDEKKNILVLCAKHPIPKKQWQRIKKNAINKMGIQGVPKEWLHCPEWPLLKNGKIDITKLKSLL